VRLKSARSGGWWKDERHAVSMSDDAGSEMSLPFILTPALQPGLPLVIWQVWWTWSVEIVSLAEAPKGRFWSETEMQTASERCCDVRN
jgi:hypothetical protein